MIVANRRCVVQTDSATHTFRPGDDIGMLPRNLIDQMVNCWQAYRVEVITLDETKSEPSDEIGTGGHKPTRKVRS